MAGIRPSSLVEVGASSGYRVAALGEEYGLRKADLVAVEPSLQAVTYGRKRFPGVEFVQAMGDEANLGRRFDLVIVHFVLHWVARDTLFQTLACLDRLCATGGYLLIGDFYPRNRLRVPYEHIDEEAYTYKQDYSEVFRASGIYQHVATISEPYAGGETAPPADEMEVKGCSLLRKELVSGYRLVEMRASE
jgi:SAM-dependent methyltransferase